MSHYTAIRTRIADLDALVKALAEVGYDQVETHDAPQPLYGYLGDRRAQSAEVIIRRKHVGRASNDLGFRRQLDGTFEAIISDYDRRKHSPAWLGHLTQRYACHATKARLLEQGFALTSERTLPDGQVHLVLRRVH